MGEQIHQQRCVASHLESRGNQSVPRTVPAAPAAVREQHYSGGGRRHDHVAAHALGESTAHESSLRFTHAEISGSRVERGGFGGFTCPMGRLPTSAVLLLM